MTFKAGTVVKDMRSGRLGTYLDETSALVRIRPIGGGLAWKRESQHVRAATPVECATAQAILLARTVPITRP